MAPDEAARSDCRWEMLEERAARLVSAEDIHQSRHGRRGGQRDTRPSCERRRFAGRTSARSSRLAPPPRRLAERSVSQPAELVFRLAPPRAPGGRACWPEPAAAAVMHPDGDSPCKRCRCGRSGPRLVPSASTAAARGRRLPVPLPVVYQSVVARLFLLFPTDSVSKIAKLAC